eukprot:2107511-Pyramimonas_sp.AAC.1
MIPPGGKFERHHSISHRIVELQNNSIMIDLGLGPLGALLGPSSGRLGPFLGLSWRPRLGAECSR